MTQQHRTETVYDDQGQAYQQIANIVQLTDGTLDRTDEQITESVYDEFGRQVKIILDDGTFTERVYDDNGRVEKEIDQLGNEKAFEYDRHGRLTAVQLPAIDDPDDANNNLVSPRYEYRYDARGNKVGIRDPLFGHSTRDQNSERETTFTFDERGNQLTRTMPDGLTETFVFDDHGRQISHTSFEDVLTEYIYDDNLAGQPLPDGRLTEKHFTASGESSVSESITMTYDAFGQDIEMQWDRDLANPGTDVASWSSEYDEHRRLIRTESPTGTINYAYDDLGRKTRVFTGGSGTYAGDQTNPINDFRFGYDVFGRLAFVSTVERNDVLVDTNSTAFGNQPEVESYAYDLLGRMDYEVNPDGSTTDYTYDDLSRLTDIDEYRADSATPDDFTDNPKLSEYSYTLRNDGKRTSADEIVYDSNSTPVSHTQFDWTYDDAGRLTEEVFTNVNDLLTDIDDYKTNFVYDLTGNRREKSTITDTNSDGLFSTATDQDTKTIYTHDANDRVLTESVVADGSTSDTTTYGYSGTQQSSKTVTDSVSTVTSFTSYAYDLMGRMGHVVIHNGDSNTTPVNKIDYRYGPDGIRISSLTTSLDTNGNVNSIEKTEYLIDASNHTGYQQVLEETVYDVDPATGAETENKKTVYSVGRDQVSQTTFNLGGPTQGETLVFHYDGHGSTRVMTDLAGAIATAAIFHYTGYGTAINFQMVDAATQYLYSGEQFDGRVGQQYLRARYYNTATGVFNRLDTFSGNTSAPQSLNKYGYTHGDPINGIDPTGESLISTIGSIGVRIGAFAAKHPVLFGGAYGAVTGAIDGYLENGSITDALVGGVVGGIIGSLLGGLFGAIGTRFGTGFATRLANLSVRTQIGLISSFLTLNLFSTGYGVYKARNTSQALFRGSLGLFEMLPLLKGIHWAKNLVGTATKGLRNKLRHSLTNIGDTLENVRALSWFLPNKKTAFSGAVDVASRKFLAQPSGGARLLDGSLPDDLVKRGGGHVDAQVNLALQGGNMDDMWGYTLFYENPGEVVVEWFSRGINQTTQGQADGMVPTSVRPAIIEILEEGLGMAVRSR